MMNTGLNSYGANIPTSTTRALRYRQKVKQNATTLTAVANNCNLAGSPITGIGQRDDLLLSFSSFAAK